MAQNHSDGKDTNHKPPEHSHSGALRTSEFPHATGLPRIAAGEAVLLRGGTQWLIHACGSEIHGYHLRRCGDNVEAERSWHVKLEGTVTALADSRYGVVATSQGEQHTDVWRIADSRAHHVAKVQGSISSVACLGTSAWVVTSRTGHSNATLTEVDLYRRVIASEQPLSSAQVELSTDVTGTYLGVLDLARGTFHTRNTRAADPCSGGTDRGAGQNPGPQRPPDQPAPAGHSETDNCCCCRKGRGAEQQPGPPTGSQTPASGQPGGTGNGPCQPGGAGVPTPGGGSVTGNGGQIGHNPPSGSGGGQGPCVADLGWRARIIVRAASNYVVADAGGRNLAVLSGQDMRVLETRQFGRRGALVLADPSSPMVLIQHRSTSQWEVLHTDSLAEKMRPIDRVPLEIDPFDEGKTFTGMQTRSLITPHANATGTVQILVLPALEAGQTFNDADMPKLAAYLERAAFTHIREYYFENSFGLLKDTRYFVYGVNSGPAGGPIQLPKLIADYYYPPYDPARVELKKSGIALPYTINFDGRESLAVHLQAATGGRPPKDVTIKFPAFLVSKNLGHFPGQIHFTGTETATLNVELPSGTSKTLNLRFPAKNIDINAEADVAGALNDLTTYLDGVFAAAETAAGISPRLFTTPSVRRIKQQGAELGFVAAWVNHRDTSGARLEIMSTSASAGADPMGFLNPAVGHIVINGTKASTDLLASYVQWAQILGEEAAGIDFTQRYMADVAAEMSGGQLVTKLTISDQDGGPGAAVTLTNSSNLGDLFDVATPVPNSDTTLDTANAPRDLTALLNDAFTAAVTRQAPPGSNYEALRDGINSYFGQFDSILIGQIGVATQDPADPNTVQPSETWTSSPPKNSGLRSVDGWRTAEFAPYKKIQAQKPWNFTFFNSPAEFAVMCHELGHALGYRDLYKQKDYRRDLAYLEDWSIMDNHGALSHHAAYHKWESGWIPPERIISVPPTDPGQATDTEALLVPVEHWNDALPGQAHAQFGANLPVVQIIELDLGGDGAVIDRIEARQQGDKFSHNLPQSPAIIITNALQPWDDTRYSSTDTTTGDTRYRRELQLLNKDNILQNPGESFDLAKAPALPAKGIVVTVVDRKEIGGIAVFRIKVHRENTAFIDLYFTAGDPYYKSPDLWVDWAGDNGPGGKSSPKPEDHRSYPPGQPTDQGEAVHVPDNGTELHWMVARVRNRGQVQALNVKLNFQVCIPPGGGDKSKNFQSIRYVTVPGVAGGDVPLEVPAQWDVPAGFGGHVCLLVDIADYEIPRDSDATALASADVWVANNWCQKNVDQYVPVPHSPYQPIEFDFSVHNAGWHSETAYLEPENLPYGMQLTVTPARRVVPAGATVLFRCKLELDAAIIDTGCRNDREFRIVAWRVTEHTAERWGGVAYKIKPRKPSVTTLTGYWSSDGSIQLTGAVTPATGGTAHVRLAFAGLAAEWQPASIHANGTFTLTAYAPSGVFELNTTALYEGSAMLGPSRSPTLKLNPPPALH